MNGRATSPLPAEKPREKPTGSSGYQHTQGAVGGTEWPGIENCLVVLW